MGETPGGAFMGGGRRIDSVLGTGFDIVERNSSASAVSGCRWMGAASLVSIYLGPSPSSSSDLSGDFRAIGGGRLVAI